MVRLNIAVFFVALSASTISAYPNAVLLKRQTISDDAILNAPNCQITCSFFRNVQNSLSCQGDFDCICGPAAMASFHSCGLCIINTSQGNTPDVFPDGVDAADQAYQDSCSTGDLSLLNTGILSSSPSTSASVVSSSSNAPASSTPKASSTGSSSGPKTSTINGDDIPTPTSSGPTNSRLPNGGKALTQNSIHYTVFGAIVLGAMTVVV